MQKLFVLLATVALVSCGRSANDKSAEPAAPGATVAAAPAAQPAKGADPCALVADPQTLFGTPVTASAKSATGQAMCEWKSEDGRLCGIVTVFVPAANSSPDPKVNFAAMVTSLNAFGEVKDVPGIGEEAKMVDGGMLGAQVALRTATNAALAVSACRSGSAGQVELAQKLASEIAGKL